MKRRDFLSGVGALGAAAALPRSFDAALRRGPFDAAPRATGFRKAVKIGMVEAGATLTEKFLLLRELGFDGVELDSPGGPPLDEVLAAKEASGLPVHGVVDSAHWSQPFSSPDPEVRAAGARALETALRDAHAWGASTVLVVPAVVGKSVSYAQAWERAHAEIAQLVPLAEELRVAIAFENVWNHFLLSPLETARWVDSFDSPAVGAYFDVGNVLRHGWPEHWIEALGKRILKVDVKEFSRRKMNDEGLWKGFEVELHEGDCDWPAVTAALRANGFEGWFTAEVAGGGRDRLARLAADLDRIFAS
jgi:L-ribulose-5-phosphate 3-epimerase